MTQPPLLRQFKEEIKAKLAQEGISPWAHRGTYSVFTANPVEDDVVIDAINEVVKSHNLRIKWIGPTFRIQQKGIASLIDFRGHFVNDSAHRCRVYLHIVDDFEKE